MMTWWLWLSLYLAVGVGVALGVVTEGQAEVRRDFRQDFWESLAALLLMIVGWPVPVAARLWEGWGKGSA